jgi:hypothetical protein
LPDIALSNFDLRTCFYKLLQECRLVNGCRPESQIKVIFKFFEDDRINLEGLILAPAEPPVCRKKAFEDYSTAPAEPPFC